MHEFSIYKGDTFVANAVYQSALGVPVDLMAAGITIEAWIKTRDNRRVQIPVTFGQATGSYSLQTETDDWPLGRNQLILRYTQGGIERTATPVIVQVVGV